MSLADSYYNNWWSNKLTEMAVDVMLFWQITVSLDIAKSLDSKQVDAVYDYICSSIPSFGTMFINLENVDVLTSETERYLKYENTKQLIACQWHNYKQ